VPFTTQTTTDPMSQIVSLIYNYPLTTIFACLLDLSQAFGGYGVSSFMSVSLSGLASLPADQLPMFYFIGSLCTIPGTLVTVLLIDRLGRKQLLPIAYFTAAISAGSLYPAALSQNLTWFYAAYGFYQFGYTLAWNTSYPMYPELFPTQYRATGIGLAVAVGRFGGIFAPFLLTAAYNSSGAGLALGLVMGFFLMTTIMSIPYSYYGIEASGKSLEEIQS
jgi:MFS family permease